jgi:type IV secretory pathway TraG/TraD family ATPase VirD4
MAFVAYAAWDYRRISQIYLAPESRSATYRDDTLNKIRSSWLFADQVQFAELLITPLTRANAEWTFNTAKQLLHYSPESRVVEKLIESAVLLGKDDEALAYLARYKAAFPKEHALWANASQKRL